MLVFTKSIEQISSIHIKVVALQDKCKIGYNDHMTKFFISFVAHFYFGIIYLC